MIAKKLIDRLADYVEQWRATHYQNPAFYYISASAIGILCGLAAAALKWGIATVTHLVFSGFNMTHGNLLVLALPVTGLLIATIYTRYVAHAPMDHGTERETGDLSSGNCLLSPRLIFGPIICCSFTLGMGGSAGTCSPISYAGAAVGSNVGRRLRLPAENVEQLFGCGAAAGIAGIFSAPIGGVMFAFEVLRMKQCLQTAIALTLSSLAAALTCYVLLGCHTNIVFTPQMRFDLHLVPWVLACGCVCGLYSLYYNKVLWRCRRFFSGISNIWVRALSGGVVLAVLLYLFPALYGEGYGTIHRLMEDEPLTIIKYGPLYRLGKDYLLLGVLFLVLLAVKPVATSATNDSGGVGGDFTPTLFCGGVVGYVFAAVVNHYASLALPCALFAFFGMAAVMGGTLHAPLMAIFMTAEMTGMYGFILPLTLATIASYVLTALFDRKEMPLLLRSNSPVPPPGDADRESPDGQQK